ncbi:MAG: hypothetical protein FRX49_12044 [Trebouxia sp. A1-2]|nr:MAG: hypothetical protein FRX49_12044 [Trebouxia sp. A1-2]
MISLSIAACVPQLRQEQPGTPKDKDTCNQQRLAYQHRVDGGLTGCSRVAPGRTPATMPIEIAMKSRMRGTFTPKALLPALQGHPQTLAKLLGEPLGRVRTGGLLLLITVMMQLSSIVETVAVVLCGAQQHR